MQGMTNCNHNFKTIMIQVALKLCRNQILNKINFININLTDVYLNELVDQENRNHVPTL